MECLGFKSFPQRNKSLRGSGVFPVGFPPGVTVVAYRRSRGGDASSGASGIAFRKIQPSKESVIEIDERYYCVVGDNLNKTDGGSLPPFSFKQAAINYVTQTVYFDDDKFHNTVLPSSSSAYSPIQSTSSLPSLSISHHQSILHRTMEIDQNPNWLFDYGLMDDISAADFTDPPPPAVAFTWPSAPAVCTEMESSFIDFECFKGTGSRKRFKKAETSLEAFSARLTRRTEAVSCTTLSLFSSRIFFSLSRYVFFFITSSPHSFPGSIQKIANQTNLRSESNLGARSRSSEDIKVKS
ncbi:hypothetical protein R6Q59_001553 [Mikania micrantha]